MTSVIDLIRKYHALGKPTLTVLMSPPVSSDRAEVPAGVLLLRGSQPSRCGHPYGSRLRFCVRSRSKRRLSEPTFRNPSRWGHPPMVEATFLRTLSTETKTPSEPMFRAPLRWGHPFGSSLFPLYMLDRNEGSLWLLFPTSPDLRLYSDTPRSGWGTHLLDQVSTWTMVETGYLTTHQRPGVESLLLAPQTFQYMVTVHLVTAMYDTSTVVADVNKRGERIRLPRLVDRANPPKDGNLQRAPEGRLPTGTI